MVRPNELSFARRGALSKLAAKHQGARPSQLTAVLVGVDPEDDSRAIVSFDGSEVSVLAGPVKMIPGALCAVEVDSANAPVRVLGPVTTRPEGLDEDVPTPGAVMPMPELGPRELTEAEAQAIQDTADNLAQVQQGLADARTEADQNFGTLDDKLGQAFPDNIFDVDLAIEQAEATALAYADQKKQEAIDAGALDLANLQIGGRNLIENSNIFSNYTPYSGATREIETGFSVPEWGAVAATRLKYTKGSSDLVTTPLIYGQAGETYTLSYWLKVLGDNPVRTRYNRFDLTQGQEQIYEPGFEGRVVVTGAMGAGYSWFQHQFYLVDADTAEFAIWQLQLERGSKATDWTPAPEDVDAGIDAAMTMANGKNAASYTDVADSVAEPGPTPTEEMGIGRPVHDMHRNRRSNGQIIGEWIWTGTAWSRLTLSDAMLSSLDVGKLTAGTANIETGVINKLWADGLVARAATFSRATIAAQNLVPGIEALSQYGDLTTEEQSSSPFREFGINTSHPSLSLTGRVNGWIWANIRVRAGERYRISVDVLSSVNGANFTIQTRNANSDGSQGTIFTSWTDLKSSDNTPTISANPFDKTSSGISWTSYWSERTATADGVISFLVYANSTSGTPSTGPQYFRNFTMRSMTDGNMLVDGAVTSRTLNVVPEEGTGGLKLDSYGMDVVGPDTGEATTFVSFRADQANAISFVQDGASTFSVSPEGELVARSVAANDSFAYRGTELADLLARAPQGLVSANRVRLQNNFSMDNTERPLFTLDVPARDPAGGVRAMSIVIQLGTYVLSSSFELSVYSTYDGSTPTLNSTRVYQAPMNTITGLTHVEVPIAGRAEHNWRFLVTVRLTTTDASERMRVRANNSTVAYVIDQGRAAAWDYQTLTGASATGTAPVDAPATPKTEQTREFPASWVRTFTGSGAQYPRASNTKAYTGQYVAQNGVLGSMVGFNRADVAAFTAGAEITNIEVFFKNVHSYSSAGMDAFWGVHGSTAPSTQNVIAGSYSARFNKGQGRWLSVPETHWNAFKSGAATGFTLKPPSTSRSYYGIFNGEQTRLRITVRK